MPQILPPTHGNLRSAFEGDSAVHKTILLATALASLLAAGVSLIVRGLTG